MRKEKDYKHEKLNKTRLTSAYFAKKNATVTESARLRRYTQDRQNNSFVYCWAADYAMLFASDTHTHALWHMDEAGEHVCVRQRTRAGQHYR